jgi:hypothetical protein
LERRKQGTGDKQSRDRGVSPDLPQPPGDEQNGDPATDQQPVGGNGDGREPGGGLDHGPGKTTGPPEDSSKHEQSGGNPRSTNRER